MRDFMVSSLRIAWKLVARDYSPRRETLKCAASFPQTHRFPLPGTEAEFRIAPWRIAQLKNQPGWSAKEEIRFPGGTTRIFTGRGNTNPSAQRQM
jgi:hypothetical protein